MTSGLQDPGPAFFAARHFDWTGGPYRALRHTFEVKAQSGADYAPRLSDSLKPLLDPTVAKPAHIYHIVDQGRPMPGRYLVYDNGLKVGASASRFVTAGRIHWLVNQGAILTVAPDTVQLHAGGVQRDGLTVVLPAPMDAGKSTTVAGLLREGYSYLSDEVVEVDEAGTIPSAYQKSLALDRASIQLLDIGEPFVGASAEPQWHIPPKALGAGGPARIPCPVALLVFPQYQPGRATRMVTLTPGEAAIALCESTFKFRERAAVALPVLTRLAEAVPARRLIISDLSQGTALVGEELGKLTESSHHGGRQHAS